MKLVAYKIQDRESRIAMLEKLEREDQQRHPGVPYRERPLRSNSREEEPNANQGVYQHHASGGEADGSPDGYGQGPYTYP